MRKWVAGATALPLIVLTAPVVVLFATSQSPTCAAPVPPAGRFGAGQVSIARTAAQLADQRHLPGRAKVIILAAGFQESGVRNLTYGDLDSVGWLQQRANWGSVAERMDPLTAAGKFYDALVRVPGWESMPITVAVQRVQRSKYPDAYAKWESSARALLAAVGDIRTGGTSSGQTMVAELNPAGAGNWQSAVRDGAYWYVYQAPDAGHKGIIHRLNSAGHELDQMTAEGADHAVSFVVAGGRVSVAFYGEVRSFPYRPGSMVTRAHTARTPWPHGEIAMDPTGRVVVIRNGNHYQGFDAASHKPLGLRVRTPTGPRQGVGVQGTTLYVLTGPTNQPARVDSWDLTTGQQLGTTDVTSAGGTAGNSYREPEGMYGSQFGVKVFTGDRRRLRIYQLGSAVDCSTDAAGGGGPVPATFNHQGNPRTVAQAVAWMQAAAPHGAAGEPVHNACERYMNLAYGLGGGYPTALAHWNAPGPKTAGMSTPPRGALVFWRSGNPAGHVALSLGNGQVISTDFDGTNYKSGILHAGPITAIDKWGPRLGWRAPNFKVGSETA